MELKRILANDTKSATEKAMALYGRDVLVISNHLVGGQTELVVAIDIGDQPEVLAGTKPTAASADSDFKRHLFAAQTKPKGQVAPPEAKSPAQQLPTVKAKAPTGADFASREMMDLIREELASLRREFQSSQQAPAWNKGKEMSPEVEELMASFTQAGMPNGLRTLLLDTVKDMRSEHEALLAVRSQLEQVSHRPSLELPQTGIHLIAGPSGSGKTTMVVRLAREGLAKHGAGKVAMISYRRRLGANPSAGCTVGRGVLSRRYWSRFERIAGPIGWPQPGIDRHIGRPNGRAGHRNSSRLPHVRNARLGGRRRFDGHFAPCFAQFGHPLE
jgi:flagellar biosynthesis protein FlhF